MLDVEERISTHKEPDTRKTLHPALLNLNAWDREQFVRRSSKGVYDERQSER